MGLDGDLQRFRLVLVQALAEAERHDELRRLRSLLRRCLNTLDEISQEKKL